MGYKVVKPVETADIKVEEKTIENGKIKVVFNDKMHIVSIYDKENGREILCGAGNVLVAYEDIPREYENWGISSYYKDKPTVIDSVENEETVGFGS